MNSNIVSHPPPSYKDVIGLKYEKVNECVTKYEIIEPYAPLADIEDNVNLAYQNDHLLDYIQEESLLEKSIKKNYPVFIPVYSRTIRGEL